MCGGVRLCAVVLFCLQCGCLRLCCFVCVSAAVLIWWTQLIRFQYFLELYVRSDFDLWFVNQVLEEACVKKGFQPTDDYCLKYAHLCYTLIYCSCRTISRQIRRSKMIYFQDTCS